ncbi:MAG: hypothetical protein ASARMPRED_005533 [Alectoria sarmentosa]|nr:MAG: hypothetical protein ASARMPRED_005533 [Alectoria sarmentosa]
MATPNIPSTLGIPFEHTPVLIIGGSMVGMTLSALLASHGVSGCVTVEKHHSTAIHPRAALFHPRTMQIYRELGLYDAMRQEAAKHYDEHAGIVNVESLAGRFLGSFMKNLNEGIESISPTMRLFLTQQMFEPILRKKVIEEGGDLRFSSELIEFQQDADGVTALVRNTETGEETLIRSKYMVAADGNRSMVREKLGIGLDGHGLLSHSITIYFDMDVGKYVTGKYNGVIYVNNDTVRGFFRIDKSGREGFLVINTAGERGTERSRYPADNITDERAQEMLRAAVGADIDFKITLISPWRAVCDNAERYSQKRVLLVGDAAATVTPHGGFGGNTGIQASHNLAWKLALVLKGQAGAGLVEQSYHEERHPIGKKTTNQVFERYIGRTAPELKSTGVEIEEEVPEPHLELGYRYNSGALDTVLHTAIIEDPTSATSSPGSIARHVVVDIPGHADKIPLADLFGHAFVLLTGPEGQEWASAVTDLNRETSLPEIRIYIVSGDQFCTKYGISASGAVLIRPDGFVAWREHHAAIPGHHTKGVPDPSTTVQEVMRKILYLEPLAAT